MRAATRWLAAAVAVLAGNIAAGQALTLPPPPPDCGSVVVVKCSKEAAAAGDTAKQDTARRIEQRRSAQGGQQMDRIIIEGDSERRPPEDTISRALSRPLVRQGETSFAIGEGAQCTCMNLCPPWPLPCCNCTRQAGNRQATAPGWKPTD